jgi:nucleotide-binding universal stress UspA family protein
MLIVGSHGRNRIERAVLGHVADRVVRKSPVSVLVVPMVKED